MVETLTFVPSPLESRNFGIKKKNNYALLASLCMQVVYWLFVN